MPGIPFLWPLVVGAAGISKTRSTSRTSDGRMRMQTCLNSWAPLLYRRRILIRQPRKPNMELPPEVEGDGQTSYAA